VLFYGLSEQFIMLLIDEIIMISVLYWANSIRLIFIMLVH